MSELNNYLSLITHNSSLSVSPASLLLTDDRPANDRALRALIIDDEPAVRGVLRLWLQRRGWQVDEADDGSKARGLLGAIDVPATREYQLIFCDLRMPNLGGPEFYEWLSAYRPEVLPHVVFISGDVHGREYIDFLRKTGCAVLEKPFELPELNTIVERVVPATPEQKQQARRA